MGDDSDLYSEVVYDEFLVCVGQLMAFAPSVDESVREQQDSGCVERLAEMLDAFIVDDFLPRYRHDFKRIRSGGSAASTAAAAAASSASAKAQRHRMVRHHLSEEWTAAHADDEEHQKQLHPFGHSQEEMEEMMEGVRAGRYLLSELGEGDASRDHNAILNGAAKVLSTVMTGGGSAKGALGQEEWVEEATRGGPQRRSLDMLAINHAWGFELSVVAEALKEESEKAESGAGMDRLFRKYSIYS